MPFKITTTVEIPDQRIKDLLCCAFEGGSNYWYEIFGFVNPEDKPAKFRRLELPLMDGCALAIVEKLYTHNRQALQQGLELMALKSPRHFSDFLNENDDAETADVFLQLCLFGDVAYG